ncbi:AEC family transporter [Pseudoruegeria sp. SK021]|uniref:AEC family transporter n=1 Tax=Pseudoruegeria sp. SK021 TaxID=1933035 RepID=UPI000A259B87|nr:AEC family transporter [Pseudoruegeria sp. SK021]OSP54056.1 transporter [Pseudoruegeria sp. SK021]
MVLLTIWPLFALICLGGILARTGFPQASFWPSAERVNYFLLFPALLFSSLANAPVRDPDVVRLGGAAVATILIAAVGLSIARKVVPTPAARFGPVLQGAVRFNTYLGLAIIAALLGPAGIEKAAVYLAIAVPVVNVLSILALTDAGDARTPLTLLRAIAKNPLILACVAGITVALLGVGLPFGIQEFFEILAQASLPLGLLCVGAALQPASLGRDTLALAGTSALRLVVMPALAIGIAWLADLDAATTLILVIFSAIPTAPTSYVLTRQLGGDGPFMAGIVTAQTLVSVATLPIILSLFA